MTTVPKAHELADALEALAPHVVADALKFEAATELRRVHAANVDCLEHFNALKAERDEMLETLKYAVAEASQHPRRTLSNASLVLLASLAIANAEA